MVADNFQPQVEDGICKHRYLYHFNDYLQAVNLCEDAIEMTHEDFSDSRNYKNNGKDTNYPLIPDISVVLLQKKDTKILSKTSFHNSEFKSG